MKQLNNLKEKFKSMSKKKRYSLLALLLVLILGTSVAVSTVFVTPQPSKPTVATKKVSTQKDTKTTSTVSNTEEKKDQKSDEPNAALNSDSGTTETDSESEQDTVVQ